MNKAFEKIMERLRSAVDKECVSSVPKVRLCDALSIVQEVAEEYNKSFIQELIEAKKHCGEDSDCSECIF